MNSSLYEAFENGSIGKHQEFMKRLHARLTSWLSRPDRCYVLLAPPIGFLFLIVTPPFQVPDEPNHFFRCYQISDGHIMPEKLESQVGGEIPRSVIDTVREVGGEYAYEPGKKMSVALIREYLGYHPPKGARTTFVSFRNTALYSPVPYLPALVGVLIGKGLGLSPLWLLYLGRLISLCSTVFLCASAIRIAPVFSQGFFLVCSTPMFVTLAASVSPDAMTNGLSVLLAGMVLKNAFREDQAPARELVLIAAVSVALALCKNLYFILSLLYFFIPRAKIGGRTKYVSIGLSIVLLSFVVSVFWFSRVADMFVAYVPGGFTDLTEPRQFIIGHPFLFSKMVAVNLIKYSFFYVRSGVGYLGWANVPLPGALIAAYVLLTVAVGLLDGGEIRFSLRQKLVLALVVIAGTLLVIVGAFIGWTEAGSVTIRAAQGRYFIPFASLYLLLLHNARLSGRVSLAKLNRFIPAFVAVFLLLALWFVVRRFYVV